MRPTTETQPMTPDEWKQIRGIARLLAVDLYHLGYNQTTQIVKNVYGRLRRQSQPKTFRLKSLDITIGAALERLEALGWPEESKGRYIAALIDNEYEADIVERLRKVYDKEFHQTGYGDEFNKYRHDAFKRNYPYLSRFLTTTIEECAT